MKTIELKLTELDNVLETRTYNTENGETKDILEDIIYEFESEGVDFTCKLQIDENGELYFSEINNKEISDSEFSMYSLEGTDFRKRRSLYLNLLRNYGFLPSYRPFETRNDYLFIGPTDISLLTEELTIDYIGFLCSDKSIYLLNMSQGAEEEQLNEEYIDEPYYDNVKRIFLNDILGIDIIVSESLKLLIYTKSGLIQLTEDSLHYIDELTSLYGIIKQHIHIKSLKN